MSNQTIERPVMSFADGIAVTPPTGQKLSVRKFGFAGVALLVAVVTAWYGREWWTVGRFLESTDDAYVGGDVTVIAPKISGFIAEVAVADNQAIRVGDLLARIDNRDYRVALAKATAAVAGQQAALANLDATRRLQEAVIAEAAASISAADAEIVRSHNDQTRFRQLSADAVATLQTFQRADSDYKQAYAAGGKARAALDAAQRQLDVIDTQKQQVVAALDAAIADRDAAQLNLSYTELRSPIDGLVGNRSAHTGAFASTGAQLFSIVPAKGLWIDANFKESQLAEMRPGLSVIIEADVFPSEKFHGHVESLAPATGAEFSVLPAENATGNFTKIVQRVPVRILLDGDASLLGRLRPGLSVTAEVDSRPAGKSAP